MLCSRCACQHSSDGTLPPAPRSCLPTCARCGAAILTLEGAVLSVGDATLAQLGRFGLANTGEPLLELRRQRK
jgi:hypothetical protein